MPRPRTVRLRSAHNPQTFTSALIWVLGLTLRDLVGTMHGVTACDIAARIIIIS